MLFLNMYKANSSLIQKVHTKFFYESTSLASYKKSLQASKLFKNWDISGNTPGPIALEPSDLVYTPLVIAELGEPAQTTHSTLKRLSRTS